MEQFTDEVEKELGPITPLGWLWWYEFPPYLQKLVLRQKEVESEPGSSG